MSIDEVQVIIGAQKRIKIFSLSGDVLLEKNWSEVERLTVADLVEDLGRRLTISSYRLTLICQSKILDPTVRFAVLEVPHDVEMQLLVAPLDPSRPPELDRGRVVQLVREGSSLVVTAELGALRETSAEPVELEHYLVVRSPDLFFDDRVERHVLDEDRLVVRLEVQSCRGFKELAMHYSSVTVHTVWRRTALTAAQSEERRCRAARRLGLLQLLGIFAAHGTTATVSIVAAMVLLAQEDHLWGAAFAATLWLPGVIWTYRYHCYILDRKFVGVGAFLGLPLCICSWCCGVIWLWTPAALLLMPLVPYRICCKLLLLMASLHTSWEPAFPIDRQAFCLYELYMRDVHLFGDPLRIILSLARLAQGVESWVIMLLASSCLSLVLAAVPMRSAWREETWRFFDETIMELVSD